MDDSLAIIRDDHFPNPPATPAVIEAFEARVGWKLDEELRRFYMFTNGAKLFQRADSPFEILPLEQVVRTRVAITGKDVDDYGPESWWAFVDVQDFNYLAVDIAQSHDCKYAIRDVFHETSNQPDYCKIIARSFGEFLVAALHSKGKHYWLSE